MSIKYFTAPWCIPCKVFGPVMDEFVSRNPNIDFQKIDLDESPESSTRYGVMSIPTVIVFDGVDEVRRFMGSKPYEFVEKFVFSS